MGCNEAIRREPKKAVFWQTRGNAWYAKRDYDHAISDYTEVIRLDPINAKVFDKRGNAWFDYLDDAEMLRPELEQVEGFVDHIRYKSLIREGWILSLSNWRDEKSLVPWRTRRRHHEVQQKGREGFLRTRWA